MDDDVDEDVDSDDAEDETFDAAGGLDVDDVDVTVVGGFPYIRGAFFCCCCCCLANANAFVRAFPPCILLIIHVHIT